MTYVVEVELIGSDEQPRSIYGPFRTLETAQRFADRIKAAMPREDNPTMEFVTAYPVYIHPARMSDIREDGWLDY